MPTTPVLVSHATGTRLPGPRKLLLGLLLPFLLTLFALAADPSGVVVAVPDGDTLTVRMERYDAPLPIRIHGIDAPEGDQPFSAEAKQYATKLVLGKTVFVQIRYTDSTGRAVADVRFPDGTLLSHRLVSAGAAWWYEKYAGYDQRLGKLHEEAKQARRGLWAANAPIPPWEWRRGRRQ